MMPSVVGSEFAGRGREEEAGPLWVCLPTASEKGGSAVAASQRRHSVGDSRQRQRAGGSWLHAHARLHGAWTRWLVAGGGSLEEAA